MMLDVGMIELVEKHYLSKSPLRVQNTEKHQKSFWGPELPRTLHFSELQNLIS